MLLDPGQDWSPLAEVLLHFAARAEHVARTIRPALEAGSVVVCDRYADSTMAYQAYAGGADPATIRQLAQLIGLEPDLTVVFTASPEVAQARRAMRAAMQPGGHAPDRYERRGAAFHAAVARGYEAIAAANPGRCVLLNADGPVDAVHHAVLAAVVPRLEARQR